jgi:hypothetical protein
MQHVESIADVSFADSHVISDAMTKKKAISVTGLEGL